MQINTVFITVNVADHGHLIDWWSKAIGRSFDRKPVPSCREWQLLPGVLLQIIEAVRPNGPVEVAILVEDVETEIQRLNREGIRLSNPVDVPGFAALKWSKVADPEGNTLNVLSGE